MNPPSPKEPSAPSIPWAIEKSTEELASFLETVHALDRLEIAASTGATTTRHPIQHAIHNSMIEIKIS